MFLTFRAELSVITVYCPLGIPYVRLSVPVKDVKTIMCPDPSPNPTPSDKNSAEIASPKFQFDVNALSQVQIEEVNKRCTFFVCDAVTTHLWIKVPIYDLDGTTEPLELLKLTKRLTMCTQCGKQSLTN